MQYLITTNNGHPFLTDSYEFENHFNEEIGMIVYDLINAVYTVDGWSWNEIGLDCL